MTVTDALGRPLRDLRISVTDRCNFRCVYCMPKEVFGRDYQFLERADLLTFEEIERLARIFVGDHGVSKIRLTGGEPLVRREVERLVERLARIPGLGDLAMTTNGSALKRKARALGDAGLRRITVSLDGLDNEVFAAINDVGFPVERVLAGIEAAAAVGLGPIKINMVVKRGVNEDGVVPMARHFRGSGHVVRFIEFMDVGHSNGWRMDEVVPAAEIVAMVDAEQPLERQRCAIATMPPSLTPRLTTMLILTGASPSAAAVSMPSSTFATGKSASFIARKVASSSESRLTVTRWSPAWASAPACLARSEPFVVSVISTGSCASIATSR